jgi:glutaredoxin 3
MAKIEIYTKAYCPYCDHAKNFLNHRNLPYEEIRVDVDSSRLAEMLERAEGRRTVPQIFINGVGIGGFTDMAALAEKGEFDILLQKGDSND